jgi:uncharacterized damage-inducible protein DinB
MNARDRRLLDDLLDSWDRNNRILVNLLRAIPADAMDLSPAEGSPSIGKLFWHMNYCRQVFVAEDAPELSTLVDTGHSEGVSDAGQLAEMLDESAKAVREAVKNRVETGRPMEKHYDYPILMLQHMIWHEGYHHGQVKLTLKMAGKPITNEQASPLTWGVWLRKTNQA